MKKKTRQGTKWTDEKIAELTRLRANGLTYKQIAVLYQVTANRIYQIIVKAECRAELKKQLETKRRD